VYYSSYIYNVVEGADTNDSCDDDIFISAEEHIVSDDVATIDDFRESTDVDDDDAVFIAIKLSAVIVVSAAVLSFAQPDVL
jgi:hypothetical protein